MIASRACWFVCCVVLIQGCGTVTFRAGDRSTDGLSPAGSLDFGWKLSGNRLVAPLQVFSDAQRTWLHWHPNQSLPVVVAIGPEGEQVVPYRRQDPYTVIDGHWPKLSFRAGRHLAHAHKINAQGAVNLQADATAASPSLPVPSPAVQPHPPAQPVKNHVPVFSVTPEDQHLRLALSRWSGLSGWRFQPEHWGVDVDIPLTAGASFTDDFVTSVQDLVASTELSDRPLQPCFYTNQVLRVVAASEPCDRTVAPGAPV